MHLTRTACRAAILLAAAALSACSSYTVLEAENAKISGLQPRVHDKASGGVRMIGFQEVGDYVLFEKVPSGKYLVVTYSLATDSPRQCSVYVNGRDAATAVFQPTGAWGNYADLVMPLDLHGSLRLQIDEDDAKANQQDYMASQDRIAIASHAPSAAMPGELRALREKLVKPLLEEDTLAAPAYAHNIGPYGAWPDIEYLAGDAPLGHLGRLRAMAAAWAKEDTRDPRVKETLALGLEYWLKKDYRDDEWWQNEIGIPRRIAQIVLLAGDALPAHLAQGALRIVDRAWPPPESPRGWGQNATARARIAIMRAVLSGDSDLLDEVRRRVLEEIARTERDGIQHDYSFKQFDVLYMGAYGINFLADAVEIAELFQDGDLAFPKRRLGILADCLLEGHQWTARGLGIDPAVLGRAIAMPGAGLSGKYYKPLCDRLIALAPPRAEELETMAERQTNDPARAWDLAGNRYFWRTGLMAHQRQAFYASFRLASQRVKGTEAYGGQNLLGYHLPDGATWIMRRGDEYFSVIPAMNWKMIPGTTCIQGDAPLPVPERGSDDQGSAAAFAGGVSDGMNGLAAMRLERPGLKAHKAAFFFDDAMVCLGAGIQSQAKAPIATAINQCRLDGPVTVHAPPIHRTILRGSTMWNGAQWFCHDGLGYAFFDKPRVGMLSGTRTGNWQRIDADKPADRVGCDVLGLWIDHGIAPKDASYAYAVVPEASPENMPQWVENRPVQVLANSKSLQAVGHAAEKLTLACFYEPGKVKTLGGVEIAVDLPCLLLYRDAPAQAVLALADPLGGSPTVRVQIDRTFYGQGVERLASGGSVVTAYLPAGPMAGASWTGRLGRSPRQAQ